METRLDRLEHRVEELVARVEALERRLTAGFPAAPDAERVPEQAREELRSVGTPRGAEISFLLGRSLLILGGAYLLRAFTEDGTLPPQIGLVIGLIYGLVWLLLAAASGKLGKRLGAAFLGVTAVLIAYPLIWETTTRFHLLPPVPAAALIAGVTTGALAVGARFGLRTTAWTATLAGIGTAFVLLVQTHLAIWYTATLVVIGFETAVMAYWTKWHLLRWPAALMADLVVAQTVAWAGALGGPPEAYAGLSRPGVTAMALILFCGYVGLAAGRAIHRSRDLSGFETVQAVAVFVVGFLGAVRVCARTGASCWWLALSALVLAGASYGLAHGYVDRLEGPSRAYHFFLGTGLALFVTGTWLLLPVDLRALVWFSAAAVAALAAAGFHRSGPAAESALLILLAAETGGVRAFFYRAFFGGLEAPRTADLIFLIAPVVLYILLYRFEPEPGNFLGRWPHLVTAALATLSASACVVIAAGRLLAFGERGPMAALRTVVVSVASVSLSVLAARFPRARELAWLSSLLLVAIGCKLVLIDLEVGTPASLVASFVSYGLALLIAPRIGRRGER